MDKSVIYKELDSPIVQSYSIIDKNGDTLDNVIDKNNFIIDDLLEHSYPLKQTTGTSNTSVMSQNAITEALLDSITYGVQWDVTSASPTLTRIGNMTMHKQLPIQNLMKGCLLSDAGVVNSYLPKDDWTSATRDGSAGQVMVEIPDFYIRFKYDSTTHIQEVRIAQVPFVGAQLWSKCYVSAYYASIQRSTLKLASVVNTTADYRGGDNTSDWDGTYRDERGTAVSSLNITNFRTYARNRNAANTKWNIYTWQVHLRIYWLFIIEYATLNSQLPINGSLTSDGYKQGGLGSGCYFIYSNWGTYNTFNPFLKNGYTDSLGNGTGEVSYTCTNSDSTVACTGSMNRYRGIEAPFGYLWTITDGVNFNIDCDSSKVDGATGLSYVYRCDDPSKFSDTITSDYKLVTSAMSRTKSFTSKMLIGDNGDIIPIENTGSSTTYYCDQFYTKAQTYTSKDKKTILSLYGTAYDGVDAGLSYVNSSFTASNTYPQSGSRLCFSN